jgi:hypothetical protein
MVPKTIMPQDTVISCAVCGRTLLQGEQPEIYLVNGARRHVCELCTVRANHQGWIRESEGPQIGHRGERPGERRPLLGRFRARRDRRREGEPEAEPQGEEEAAPEAAAGSAPAAPEADSAPAGPREPRHVHAVPTSEELKAVRAVEVFNGSEHPRTVAGVARSLGVPSVAVNPSVSLASVVQIVVAWELCWYRYEVDLADEGVNGVRAAGQGYELSELEPHETAANAAADEHGLLAVAAS